MRAWCCQDVAYCEERGISANRCGKLIVATDESQIEAMVALKQKGDENDVPELELLGRESILALEPQIGCRRDPFACIRCGG